MAAKYISTKAEVLRALRQHPQLGHLDAVTRNLIADALDCSHPWWEWWQSLAGENQPQNKDGYRGEGTSDRDIEVTKEQWENHYRHLLRNNPWRFMAQRPLDEIVEESFMRGDWPNKNPEKWPKVIRCPHTKMYEWHKRFVTFAKVRFGYQCRVCCTYLEYRPGIREGDYCGKCDSYIERIMKLQEIPYDVAELVFLTKRLKNAA